jgi:Holliday junction resolvasome RuvABC endonuclease subunit
VNILGIDIGSKVMAFAILKDGKYIKSWFVDVADKNANIYLLAHNAVLESMRIWESECLIDKNEDFVCFEDIPMRFGWARILVEIVGIVKTICGRRDYGFVELSPTTIKKKMLGSGKSPENQKEKKQLMIDYINKKFGLALNEHNLADAIAIALTAYLLEKELI